MTETATFAAGCFWSVEEAFCDLEGVISTRVGYTGGHTEHPAYRDVCAGDTGHAEAVEILFDPESVSYEKLLQVFWSSHDPTQLNRQGPDFGTQYRSAVFFHNENQQAAAESSKAALDASGQLRRQIVTQILPAGIFWEAEEYHQKYHKKNGGGCGF